MGAQDESNSNAGARQPNVCRAISWTGALKDAKELHDAYNKALEEYVSFQDRHDDKILLWTTIRELLVRASSNDELDVGDLFGALNMKIIGPKDPAEKLKEELRTERAVWKIGRGMSVDDVVAETNEMFSEDQRFVLFGREYVFRQTAVTVQAYKLIQYLKTGTEPFVSSLDDLTDLQRADLSSNNEFYEQFKEAPYPEQIRIVQRLTSDLDKCGIGREFLADLFEYRREAIFDPFGFIPPLPLLWEDTGYHDKGVLLDEEKFTPIGANQSVEKPTVSVFVKHSDELEPYYTDDYRVDVSESNVAGVQCGTYLSDLLAQLLPGLGYFYATRIQDEVYMDRVDGGLRPHPVTVFGRFMFGVISAFASDDHIRTVIEKTNPDGLTLSDWSGGVLSDFRTEGTFANKDVDKLVTTIVGSGEVFFSTFKLPGSNFATSLKGMLSVLTTFHLFTQFGDVARMNTSQRMDSVLSMAMAVTDAASVVTLGARRLGNFVKVAGVALNGITAIFNFVRMAEAFADGDDVGIGYGMTGLGLAIWTGVGIYATTATTAASGAAIIGAALWLGIGVVLIGIGTILVILLKDGPFKEWLERTYFGKDWDGLDKNDRNFYYPGNADTYGYKHPIRNEGSGGYTAGGVNFLRQVSGLYSTARPIGATVDFGLERRDDEFPARGHIVVEPGHTNLLEDGYLFVHPIEVYKDEASTPSVRYSDPISDTCIHRLSLADRPGDSTLQSRTDLRVAMPDLLAILEGYDLNWALAAIEKHAETDFGSRGLELEIVDVETEVNDDKETAITRWEAKIWDMSGSERKQTDWIFGFPLGDVGRHVTRYFVELIYVPPELARAIESDGNIWFRPELLPSVSREIHTLGEPAMPIFPR